MLSQWKMGGEIEDIDSFSVRFDRDALTLEVNIMDGEAHRLFALGGEAPVEIDFTDGKVSVADLLVSEDEGTAVLVIIGSKVGTSIKYMKLVFYRNLEASKRSKSTLDAVVRISQRQEKALQNWKRSFQERMSMDADHASQGYGVTATYRPKEQK